MSEVGKYPFDEALRTGKEISITKETLKMGKNALNIAGKFVSSISGNLYLMSKNVFTNARMTEDDLDKPNTVWQGTKMGVIGFGEEIWIGSKAICTDYQNLRRRHGKSCWVNTRGIG